MSPVRLCTSWWKDSRPTADRSTRWRGSALALVAVIAVAAAGCDGDPTSPFAGGSEGRAIAFGGLDGPGQDDPDGEPDSGPDPEPGVAAECRAPDPAWIWCDDFEADRLDRYFEHSGADGGFVRRDGVGVGGSAGMRARFRRGDVSPGGLRLAFGRTPDRYFHAVDDGRRDYREVYWRVFVRNQDGWVGGGGDKLSRATSLASGGWAQAMIAHVWSGSGDTRDALVLDPASGTDRTGRLRTRRYNDFTRLRWLGKVAGSRPIFAPDGVGRWYCVEARARLNDPGRENGLFELWIDGRLETRIDGLNWVGSFQRYGINAVFLENYWNDGSPRTQERYFDRFVVSTEPIGC